MYITFLDDTHRSQYYKFLERQKLHAIKNDKQWNLPTNLDLIRYNEENRRVWGLFIDDELKAVGGYQDWGFAPYRLLDTFTIDFTLSFKDMITCGKAMCKFILQDSLKYKIYTVYFVGELRMWELLGFTKKGFFWKEESKWTPKKVCIVPAGNRSQYSMIDRFMDYQSHLFDMLIYKVEYDTNHLTRDELLDAKCIAELPSC